MPVWQIVTAVHISFGYWYCCDPHSAPFTVTAMPFEPENVGVTCCAGPNCVFTGGATGEVLSTDDSFDKVYSWYQQNLPAGSEKSHVTAPVQTAVFTIGEAAQGQTSVTLTTQGSKTIITIAHVKM